MANPHVTLDLTWIGDLSFRADAPAGRALITDGNSHAGLSPMELLAAATASCMAIDVVHILTRSRAGLTGLRVGLTGDRADTDPRRFRRLRLIFDVDGVVAQSQLDRALQLSKDKYCSVWNSLREDIELELVTHITSGTMP
jgi:putative redox protein